jgi:hypothetical protein
MYANRNGNGSENSLEMAINTELVGTLARQAKHNIRLSQMPQELILCQIRSDTGGGKMP